MQTTFEEPLQALKGQGRVIMCGKKGEAIVNLLLYADETWGIDCGGKSVGMWEVREENECFRAFREMCDSNNPAVIPT